MTPELEKLIKETVLCIEGLTYLDDVMLDETKQDSPICKIYGLTHGLLCRLGVAHKDCVHERYFDAALKEYKEILKSANIMDVEDIIKNSTNSEAT